MDALLRQVHSPSDLKKLNGNELIAYCDALRRFIIDTVQNTGGHLASSLGAVELAAALHYVFDSPTDKILWDVGHQAYAHKIITGRADAFDRLRTNGGISGFPRMTESEHDAFTMGHSSNSLSVGLGYARARDTRGEHYNVIAVIGDGAFTGGMAFEALNDIGASNAKMIIVLNDNKMSISKNVGAMSQYLSKLRLSKRYSRIKYTVKKGLLGIPLFGRHVYKALDRTKDTVKSLMQTNKMFEQMGIKYYGPIDGHNLTDLVQIFRQVRAEAKPVLLHIVTEKGKGDAGAQSDPSKFHGVSPHGTCKEQAFSEVVSRFLCTAGETDERVVAITAAMADGTGLSEFCKKFPERCYDVGIAEQHAVTLAAGLAAGGCKPYVAVYSSFLQRGFDQILHDVCINRLPVTFLIDRAGAVGPDGLTHQGIYDLGYLSMIPDMTVLAPKDGNELEAMLSWSLTYDKPLAIRYPKGYGSNRPCGEVTYGQWEVCRKANSNVYVLAVGGRALEAAEAVESVNILHAGFVKPLDEARLDSLNRAGNLLITVEDNALYGGFGQAVLAYLNGKGLSAEVRTLGYSDAFLDDYAVDHSLQSAGISAEGIRAVIKNFDNSMQ